MSKYGITIRHAELEDKDRIIEFLRDHWKADHIFVVCPELFAYYHMIDSKLTFVIAEDDTTKKIYGLQGYIVSNQTPNPDAWGVIWRTIPCPFPSLGIAIMKHIRKSINSRIFAGVGANPKTTIPLLKALGEKTGKLKHYYRLSDRQKYQIAVVNDKIIQPLPETSRYDLIRLSNADELKECFDIERYRNRKPYKDIWYVDKRYFQHPMNSYIVYGISKGTRSIDSVLIAREQRQNGEKALRILDFIGEDNDLTGIGYSLQGILDENNYEYLDFYCKGISHEVMTKAGFTLRDEKDDNIIPNYFEPFVRENIDIYYNTSDDDNYYVFKADGDQDRPSIIR